jgi:hypothetical protein
MHGIPDKSQFTWFNKNTMAVYRTEVFTYTLWQHKDDTWGCSIDMKLDYGLANAIGTGRGNSWEEALREARMNTMIKLMSLYNKV